MRQKEWQDLERLWLQEGCLCLLEENRTAPSLTDRQFRLIACAYGRHISLTHSSAKLPKGNAHLRKMDEEDCQQAELFADGKESADALAIMRFSGNNRPYADREARCAAQACLRWTFTWSGDRPILAGIVRDIYGNPYRIINKYACCDECGCWYQEQTDPTNSNMGVRDVCSNCGSTNVWAYEAFPSPWLRHNDSTILRLAESIYQNRSYECLPSLADAAEEAGCSDQNLLQHLRGFEICPECLGGEMRDWCRLCGSNCWIPLRSPHYRGCHALDLLRGLHLSEVMI
jgi:hypothetical protein